VLALLVLTTQIAIMLTPQSRKLMGVEILVPCVIVTALNGRNRVGRTLTSGAPMSFFIRLSCVYSAVSLIVGIGGRFYVLGLVLLATLARTMASCWALLTASDLAPPPSGEQ
jgi:hypothetical protein